MQGAAVAQAIHHHRERAEDADLVRERESTLRTVESLANVLNKGDSPQTANGGLHRRQSPQGSDGKRVTLKDMEVQDISLEAAATFDLNNDGGTQVYIAISVHHSHKLYVCSQ